MKVLITTSRYEALGPLGELRRQMHDLVAKVWRTIDGFDVSSVETSAQSRFAECDARAGGHEIYGLVDDDCIPEPTISPAVVMAAFDAHRDFGVMALRNALNPTRSWGMWEDQDLVEAASVGGVRFLRRGLVPHWPENFDGDDTYHARMIQPMRSAYLRNHAMIHVGEWRTTWRR